MSSLKSILVVMSPQRHATPALHRAIAYAHRTKAVLHLYLFDHYAPIDYSRNIFGAEVSDRARHDFLQERMQWLSEQAAGLAAQGLRVECDVIWAPSAHKSILAKVLELKPDLVIKDVDSEPADGLLRPSGLDWKLLRLCPSLLMLVHPRARLLPQQLLAAVDVTITGEEGKLNHRVVAAASACAGLSEGSFKLASIFSYVPVDTYGSGFIADTYDIMNNGHREALANFAALHSIPPLQILRRSAFDVAEGIAACARDTGTDLVVLGSAYHSGFDRLMFGTTAEALIRRLACDVLLVSRTASSRKWPGISGFPRRSPCGRPARWSMPDG
ncbi:MAG TPA: universal stress protein [Nevskia sp.]|nr:universal stress protein [Nevskia sp.]